MANKINLSIDKKTGCWNWMGSKSHNGYGKLKVKQKSTRATHYFYERYVGKIPSGKVIDHLCKNVACVNPKHLEVVSIAENTRRGRSAKLNYEKVNIIKRLYIEGLSQIVIGKKFGINQGSISRILNNKAWSVI